MRVGIYGTDKVNCRGERTLWGDPFWMVPRVAGLYAYEFCFDPGFLGELSEPPVVDEWDFGGAAQCETPKFDLIIVPHDPHPLPWTEELVRLIEGGTPAVLVQPDPAILSRRRGWEDLQSKKPLLSNKEDWRGWADTGNPYQYPQQLWFQRFTGGLPADAQVQRWVGEWPDVLWSEGATVFTSDAIHAYEFYRQSPSAWAEEGFIGQFTRLFVDSLRHTLGLGKSPGLDWRLRRDFHAYGWARLMILDLARMMGQTVDLSLADRIVWAASRNLLQNPGEVAAARACLKGAFSELAGLREKLAHLEQRVLDGVHGGILFENIGFAEYDYPTMVNEWFEVFGRYIDEYDYRLNVDIGASTHEMMAERHPRFYSVLSNWWQSGKLEFVNGTYGQPYMPYFSWESAARQVELGQAAMRDSLGQAVQTYVSQEFGFTPQLPGILKGYGYTGVSHRTQNWGSTPVEAEPAIWWQGVDGARLAALPAQISRSEHDPWGFFLHLPIFAYQACQAGDDSAAYVNTLDIFAQPPCRDEAIRCAFYAPVFGTFQTYRNYLADHQPEKIRRYGLEDYTFTTFSDYEWGASMAETLHRCQHAEVNLLCGEMLEAVGDLIGGRPARSLNEGWKVLLAYENHDTFCVPKTFCGGHTGGYVHRHGPHRRVTAEQTGRQWLETELDKLKSKQEERLAEIAAWTADGKSVRQASQACLLFNPTLETRTRWLVLPECEGEDGCWYAGDRPLLQKIRDGVRWVQATLPGLGYQVVCRRSHTALPEINAVWVDGNTVYSDNLKVEFDSVRGLITGVWDRHGDQLCNQGNELVFGESSRMLCREFRLESDGISATAYSSGEVYDQTDQPLIWYRSIINVRAGETKLYGSVVLHPVRPLTGDAWIKAIRLRVDLGEKIESVSRMCGTYAEPTGESQFTSMHLAMAERRDGWRIFLHNDGAHHYRWNGRFLENILLPGREEMREFEYAMEWRREPLPMALVAEQHRQPVLIYPFLASGAITPETGSFLTCETPGIMIGSIRNLEGELAVRFAEVEGQEKELMVKIPELFTVLSIRNVRYDGVTLGELPLIDGEFQLPIGPWQVTEVRLRLQKAG